MRAIVNGRVLDGTGAPERALSVLIDGDRIVDLLPPDATVDAELIDAQGNIVAPGFIDLHSHADFTVRTSPAAVTQLHQGVTTVLTGNCGWSPFPITDLDELRAGAAFLGAQHDWSWQDAAGFAEGTNAAINVALQVGHCTLRIAAMGSAKRPPSPEELRRMQDLLRQAADQGAVGFSTGLIYAPGAYADPTEVAALVATAAECGLLYSTHIRNEGTDLLQALDEAVTAARAGGARLEVSHLKAVGKRNHGLVAAALDQLDQARADGVDVTWDTYPYTATSTTLTTRLPLWALDGGTHALLARLNDPTERDRIAHAVRASDLDPTAVVIASLPPGRYFDARGHSLAEIAQADNVDAAEAVCRVLQHHHAAVGVVNHAMSPEDVVTVLQHPCTSIASDGWILDATGPGHPHPRNFGTFPRVLGHYAREQQVLTLPEAVRRMTGLPAARLGLTDRGVLKAGAVADVAVFNPEQIADRSTYADPWQLSVGVEHVLVAGEPVLANGEQTGVQTGMRPGRVLTGS